MESKKSTAPIRIEWNWRRYFDKTALSQGESDAEYGRMRELKISEDGRMATGTSSGGFHCLAVAPGSASECRHYEDWREGLPSYLRRQTYYRYDYTVEDKEDEGLPDHRFSCDCSLGHSKKLCRHLASLMAAWETARGGFCFEETEEEKNERIAEEAAERERKRREEERKEKEAVVRLASSYFQEKVPPVTAGITYNPRLILEKVQSNQYEWELAEAIKEKEGLPRIDMSTGYEQDNAQVLRVSGDCDGKKAALVLGRKTIRDISCTCGRSRNPLWRHEPITLCCHLLLVYEEAWNRILAENPGDETDKAGNDLLKILSGQIASLDEMGDAKAGKAKLLTLTPRITKDSRTEELQLSFTIGRRGEREYQVRGLEKLVSSCEEEASYALSSAAAVNFASETFTDDAARWYGFIVSRVKNIERINDKLERKNSYYYSSSTVKLSIGSSIPLEGSDLDLIYDMTEGTELFYQTGKGNVGGYVAVKPGDVALDLKLSPVKDGQGNLIAIDMTGVLPRFLSGNQYQYILDEKQFGRVSENELKHLEPYRRIANRDMAFSCRVGVKKFPEFYYRILPEMRSSAQIILHDHVGEPPEGLLPAEPEFVFYIDLSGEMITCRAVVRYGEQTFLPGFDHDFWDKRDIEQEKRVLSQIRQLFPESDAKSGQFLEEAEDENLIHILTEGVGALSRFGEVRGSEAFQRVRVRPLPQPRVCVQIDGGLLELSIMTKDMTAEELLELLSSYRQKKRWHRLRDGNFVDLRNAGELASMEEIASSMDVALEKLIEGSVRLPKYRALYVDRLLESHDEIAMARDRHFKALVRAFRTIGDSDYEIPQTLSDTVRPYQLYGFRWLSTISQAGFGGILADEMGLGKTLQALAFLLSLKQEGERKPFLVVCPASLVYNWKEECARFTPELETVLLAGNLPQRKAVYKKMAGEPGPVLYVTSYDLMKKDITYWEKMVFSTVILDEAQVIKNPINGGQTL